MKSFRALLPFLMPLALSAQTEFQKGLSWYDQRTDAAEGIQAQREPIERAITYFEQALNSGSNELEAGIYLCRSLIFKGRFVETDSKKRTKALGEAKDIAEKLLVAHPKDRNLRFEHLAALGLWGESLGILRAAREGVATRMKEACETMLQLDPEFKNGVGRRSLAVLNYKVPAIPFIISWPDKKKSAALLKEVMSLYPDDMANNFYYAEYHYLHGEKNEAEKYLNKVLSFSPEREHLLDHRLFHLEAKKMLDKLQGR